MHAEGFFYQALVYLGATVVSVPLAKRFGLGSVLGYLLAGVLIGPFGLGLVGQEGADVMHFAEFGVVMMLFVVGLELEPALLWRMRVPIVGLGGLQVAATTAVFGAIGLVLGLPWRVAVALGLTLAMSSTAIAVQTLQEKGLMKSSAGKSAFAVLLFQDLAVIPILAVFPLLASGPPAASTTAHDDTWVAHLPGWAQTLVVLATVGAIVFAGRFGLGYVFRTIAKTRLRELFTAATLLLVIGIAVLMTKVGLSPALGTFVAGVVLAGSEYRHELESDIDPFKGLLLGLFFIAVGASINFTLVAESPGRMAAIVVGILAVKLALLFGLGRIFKLTFDQGFLFGAALSQVGEFAFVLLSYGLQERVLPAEVANPAAAAVAISMAFTPLLMLFAEHVVLPRAAVTVGDNRESDEVDEENAVIVAGFGRFGQIVTRLLRLNGVGVTVLDADSEQVDALRGFGHKVFYGDATRMDLLQAAGAHRAKLFIVAIDNHEKAIELVRELRTHYPHLRIFVRAAGRSEAFEFIREGVDHVYRELFGSSIRLGTHALEALGMRAHRAYRAGQIFARHDERVLREMASIRREGDWLSEVRQRTDDVERTMRADIASAAPEIREDSAWDPDSLREDVAQGTFPTPSIRVQTPEAE